MDKFLSLPVDISKPAQIAGFIVAVAVAVIVVKRLPVVGKMV